MCGMKRLLDKIEKKDGCWRWKASKNKLGYGHFYYGGRMTLAHRVSWIVHRGQIPDGLCVLHHCDNPECCNPEHLFLGTRKENNEDMDRKGRRVATPQKGEAHGQHKMKEEDVAEIRSATGTQQQIASRFGLSQAQVSRIRSGENWSHVT